MAERREFRIDGTLDIECADWDRFQLAATYDGHRPRIYYNGDEMIDDLRRRGGIYFAHAGGIYDLLYVVERCRARGITCQIDRSQHRITRVVIGKLQLRDSYALWPAPLDELCGALGVSVPSLPWDCNCGRDCGGYCKISDRAKDGDPDLEDYCKQDAMKLYDALHLLKEFCAEHKIHMRGTLGQTAWINAQDELGIPDSDMPWHLWRHAKRGDKGGRGAIIRPVTHGAGVHHDICNAYPGQLARAMLPVGTCREVGERGANRCLDMGRAGLYTLTVRVPEDSFLPPLPWTKGGMLTFPVGEFAGTWPLPELVAAFERGVTIVKAHAALVWETTAPIFGPLIDRWYEIRRSVGRKSPLGKWIGGCAKSLTGKLSERPERERATMNPDTIKICTRKGQCRNGCNHRCGAYKQLDLFGHVWGIPYQRLGPSAYPQWSGYLRAMTRVQWLSQAERMGRDLCMGNTDSLWHTSRQSPEPLGDGLGEWEYQHAWSDLEVRSISTYAFRDEHGKFHARGIPGITEEDWRRGAGSIDRGIVTFGNAVKSTRGLFQKRHRRWTLPRSDREIYGDRKMGPGGITTPLHADEIRQLAEDQKRRRQIQRDLSPGATPLERG